MHALLNWHIVHNRMSVNSLAALKISVWLGIDMMKVLVPPKNGRLEFVKPNVLTPIRGSSSVVIIYVQGKQFYTCHNIEMAGVGE